MRVACPRSAATIGLFVAGLGWLAALSPAQAPGERSWLEEKLDLLAQEQNRLLPRGGQWVVVYRERERPRSEEVIAWECAGPQTPGTAGTFLELPCWLPFVLTTRAEGLVDADGQPYTGPLLARAHGLAEILGPYPEGFVCAIDGAFEISVVSKLPLFTEGSVGVNIYCRRPHVFLELDDGPWPPNPDFYIGLPSEEHSICSATLAFVGFDKDRGFRLSPVTSTVVGPERVIFAEAHFTMPDGKPAWKLPVRYEWQLEPVGDIRRAEVVHEGETDHEGRAADSIQVPREVTKGRVRFWCHELGAEYCPASGAQFDFSQPAP